MCTEKIITAGEYFAQPVFQMEETAFAKTERLWNLVLAARRARMKAYETELAALDDFAEHVRGINK